MAISDHYDIVIGLEVHCQLNTKSKLFCGCLNQFGSEPNSNTCPVCLGLPGTLPVLNRDAFDSAIKAACAVGAEVASTTKFDRKHYFYPDLPKGYQISQFDEPYCKGGGVEIEIEGEKKFITLNRIHMEEDAGKLSHSEDSQIEDSIVDLNRTGTPLLEIVSEPVMSTPQEAAAYLTELKQLLQYIGVSDCNMQEGSLRCDANISLKPKGASELGTKVEIKNMNSFKGVQAALETEIKRQYQQIESGKEIVQETRLYDADKNQTRSMRTKEEADDYRYFPEPDLPRYEVDRNWVDEMRAQIGELPQERKKRFKEEYQLPDYDIEEITVTRELADYFEESAKGFSKYKEISNWIMGEIKREMGERKVTIGEFPVQSDRLVGLLKVIDSGDISKSMAKEKVFPEMLASEEQADDVVARLGLKVESDEGVLQDLIKQAIEQNDKIVQDILGGKGKALGALVGFCMKQTKGKANPAKLSELLSKEIEKLKA